jgi:hypothetical protein
LRLKGFASKGHSVTNQGRFALGTVYSDPEIPNFDAKPRLKINRCAALQFQDSDEALS